MAKVSVIISTYQRPDKLKKAIESVLNQTYKDYEIIVAVDGSEEIHTPNGVKVIHIPHFGNDTKPKNAGLSIATGEYIAFLDDDNEFRPDHLQALVNVLDNNPDIALAYGDRWIVDETNELKPQIGVYSEFSPSILLKRNYIDTSDALVRKNALDYVGGFDERYKKYIDWNLWVRLAKAGYKFQRVPIVLTDYHLHKQMKSVTVSTDKERVEGGHVPEWDAYDCEIRLNAPKPKVAIFSLTYDRLDYTKKCFESLHKTAGYDFDHFVVDNGSTDGTVEWLESEYLPKELILNEENKGISIASNQAIEVIKREGNYDIIVKVDNDCLFLTSNWLKKMVEIWESNHMIALSCYVQGLKDSPGGAPRIGHGMIKGELVGMTKHLGGICHFVSARAYDNWKWDEHSFLHGLQDLEFSQYLLINGYQMGYLENYFCEHVEGTAGQHKAYPEYFERRKKEKTTRYENNK